MLFFYNFNGNLYLGVSNDTKALAPVRVCSWVPPSVSRSQSCLIPHDFQIGRAGSKLNFPGINANGVVDDSDVSLVKSKSGSRLE